MRRLHFGPDGPRPVVRDSRIENEPKPRQGPWRIVCHGVCEGSGAPVAFHWPADTQSGEVFRIGICPLCSRVDQVY